MSSFTSLVRRASQFIKTLSQDPIYPLFLAIYPILFIYVNNVDELTLDALYTPLLSALIIISVTFLLGYAFIRRNWHRAALAVGAITAFFYFYKPAVNLFPHSLFVLAGREVTRGQVVMPLSVLLVTLTIYCAFRLRLNTLQKLTKIVNIITFVLVGITIINIAIVEFNRVTVNTVNTAKVYSDDYALNTSALGYKPDIYYLIFDRYGSNKTFSQYYNYDNSDFTNNLIDKGFYIAEESHANYPRTVFSLSSSLNMDFIQNMVNMSSPNLSEASTLDELFNNHKVGRILKKSGYKYYHLGNWYGITNRVQIADENVLPKRQGLIELDDFSRNILDTTFFSIASTHYFKQFSQADFGDGHRELIEFSTAKLEEIPHTTSPKLVISHILLPHEPYVFDAECREKEVWTKNPEASKQDFLDQLTCANQKINSVLDSILSKSENPPIIILQGDEGPWPHVNRLPNHTTFKDASDDAILERNRILNAYYFPDKNYGNLYASITPVNSFRLVFNQYFGQDLPPLEDKLYVFYENSNHFNLMDVTKRVEHAEQKGE